MPDTEQITIQGRTFNVPNPYEDGHVCTANEAAALNQVFHENIRNNLAKKLSEGQDEAQAQIDSYSSTYQFGVRTGGGGGGGPRDPIKVEAMRIGREAVKNAILKKGLKIEDFGAKQISERAAATLPAHPEWTEEAKRRVTAARQIADETLANMDLGVAA